MSDPSAPMPPSEVPPPIPPGAPAPPPMPPEGYAPPPPGYVTPPPGYGYPAAPPPGYPAPYPGQVYDPQAKSKVVAGLLGIFLGGLGIQRFYLGFTKIGVIQIIVTVLTCGLGAIWGFVEGILYLVGTNGYTQDSDGRPLRN